MAEGANTSTATSLIIPPTMGPTGTDDPILFEEFVARVVAYTEAEAAAAHAAVAS